MSTVWFLLSFDLLHVAVLPVSRYIDFGRIGSDFVSERDCILVSIALPRVNPMSDIDAVA